VNDAFETESLFLKRVKKTPDDAAETDPMVFIFCGVFFDNRIIMSTPLRIGSGVICGRSKVS